MKIYIVSHGTKPWIEYVSDVFKDFKDANHYFNSCKKFFKGKWTDSKYADGIIIKTNGKDYIKISEWEVK